MKIPKGILLTISLFLMLAGASIQQVIFIPATFFPFSLDGRMVIPSASKSLDNSLIPLIALFFYILSVYGLYYRTRWAMSLTIVGSSIYSFYGFISIILILAGWFLGGSKIDIITGPTVALFVLSIYKLIIAILLVYVILYLRKPEVKSWLAGCDDEKLAFRSSPDQEFIERD